MNFTVSPISNVNDTDDYRYQIRLETGKYVYAYGVDERHVMRVCRYQDWQHQLGKLITLAILTGRDPVLIIRDSDSELCNAIVKQAAQRYTVRLHIMGSNKVPADNNSIDDLLLQFVTSDTNTDTDSDDSDDDVPVEPVPVPKVINQKQCAEIFRYGTRKGERCPNGAAGESMHCYLHTKPGRYGFVTQPSVPLTVIPKVVPTPSKDEDLEAEYINGLDGYYKVIPYNIIMHITDDCAWHLVGELDSDRYCVPVSSFIKERWRLHGGVTVDNVPDEVLTRIIGVHIQ